jgi:hypothetical protein
MFFDVVISVSFGCGPTVGRITQRPNCARPRFGDPDAIVKSAVQPLSGTPGALVNQDVHVHPLDGGQRRGISVRRRR